MLGAADMAFPRINNIIFRFFLPALVIESISGKAFINLIISSKNWKFEGKKLICFQPFVPLLNSQRYQYTVKPRKGTLKKSLFNRFNNKKILIFNMI